MMKKRSSWLRSVKKVLRYSPNDLPENKKENKRQWQYDTPEVVSFDHFPDDSSPDVTYDETTAFTPVTEYGSYATAVVASQATTKVVRLTGHGCHYMEERAATLIQSFYRGYLARRALRALKGLVRLQALVRGHNVRKQAQRTMQCMEALLRVQARVLSKRIQFTHEKFQFQKEEENAKSPLEKNEIDGWDNRNSIFEKIIENVSRNHNPVMKRERALAYAFSYQELQQSLQTYPNENVLDFYGDGLEMEQWGWNWLDHSSQPYPVRLSPARPYNSTTTGSYDTPIETVHTNMVTPLRSDNFKTGLRSQDSVHTNPYPTWQQPRQPNYMVPTQSAKAKVRTQGSVKPRGPYMPQWNSSRKGSVLGSVCDSSSSGHGL